MSFRVDVVTIFPEYLAPLRQSLLGKAAERGLVSVGVHDLRQWTADVHRTVDDAPYGGGPGMVMKPEPWARAIEAATGAGTRDARTRSDTAEQIAPATGQICRRWRSLLSRRLVPGRNTRRVICCTTVDRAGAWSSVPHE